MGDQPAADCGCPPDPREAGERCGLTALPSHSCTGLQHGPPVDGRSQEPQVSVMPFAFLRSPVHTDVPNSIQHHSPDFLLPSIPFFSQVWSRHVLGVPGEHLQEDHWV